MLKKNIFLLIILVATLVEAASKNKFKGLFFRNILTGYNPKYIDRFESSISKDRRTANLTLYGNRETPVDFWMQLNIDHYETATKKFRGLFAYNINTCAILSKELNRFSLTDLWMNNLLKYSNMPKTCPWKEGVIYWHNLRPEKDSIPAFVSSGQYRINARFYFRDLNNALYSNLSMFVDIKMK